MSATANLNIYGLQEAFFDIPDNENINLSSPGYFFHINSATRNTIVGLTQPAVDQISLPPGVYIISVNLIIDIVTAAGASSRYGGYYFVEIGGVIQNTPANYSYVTDSTDTGNYGDYFNFQISLPVTTIIRLNHTRNRGGTGQLLTLRSSVGIVKVA